MKRKLFTIKVDGTGRVSLSIFYSSAINHDQWQLTGSADYLRVDFIAIRPSLIPSVSNASNETEALTWAVTVKAVAGPSGAHDLTAAYPGNTHDVAAL